ncbi:unnamed protein product [Amoebophrya sp. A120]|nr:unnamed protein product [Amoebophrya sp. A120]|eukprot:GSA120T00022042001.1
MCSRASSATTGPCTTTSSCILRSRNAPSGTSPAPSTQACPTSISPTPITFTVRTTVSGNTYKFSEGKAMEWQGDEVEWKHNEFAFNGFNALDGAHTVRVKGASSDYNTIPPLKFWYNTFRHNGHVSAVFATEKASFVQRNRIQHQNVGELQHDGEAVGAGSVGTEDSRFMYNWVDYGHHSLSLRFDCSQTATFSDVSRNGTMMYNLGYGLSPKLIVKGEDHQIHYNTILDGEMHICRDFGSSLCGMNRDSFFNSNMASLYKPRGEGCTSNYDGVSIVNGLPTGFDAASNKLTTSGTSCSFLRDCERYDFRPHSAASPPYGAFLYHDVATEGAFDAYNVPGKRLLRKPQPFTRSSNVTASAISDLSLIFIEERDCELANYITLYYNTAEWPMDNVSTIQIPAGMNVLHVDSYLLGYAAYEWAVTSGCSGDTVNATGLGFTAGVGPLIGLPPTSTTTTTSTSTTTTTTTLYVGPVTLPPTTTTTPIPVTSLYNTNATAAAEAAGNNAADPVVPATATYVAAGSNLTMGSASSNFVNTCGTNDKLLDATLSTCAAFVTAIKSSVCEATNSMLQAAATKDSTVTYTRIECTQFQFTKIAIRIDSVSSRRALTTQAANITIATNSTATVTVETEYQILFSNPASALDGGASAAALASQLSSASEDPAASSQFQSSFTSNFGTAVASDTSLSTMTVASVARSAPVVESTTVYVPQSVVTAALPPTATAETSGGGDSDDGGAGVILAVIFSIVGVAGIVAVLHFKYNTFGLQKAASSNSTEEAGKMNQRAEGEENFVDVETGTPPDVEQSRPSQSSLKKLGTVGNINSDMPEMATATGVKTTGRWRRWYASMQFGSKVIEDSAKRAEELELEDVQLKLGDGESGFFQNSAPVVVVQGNQSQASAVVPDENDDMLSAASDHGAAVAGNTAAAPVVASTSSGVDPLAGTTPKNKGLKIRPKKIIAEHAEE